LLARQLEIQLPLAMMISDVSTKANTRLSDRFIDFAKALRSEVTNVSY